MCTSGSQKALITKYRSASCSTAASSDVSNVGDDGAGSESPSTVDRGDPGHSARRPACSCSEADASSGGSPILPPADGGSAAASLLAASRASSTSTRFPCANSTTRGATMAVMAAFGGHSGRRGHR